MGNLRAVGKMGWVGFWGGNTINTCGNEFFSCVTNQAKYFVAWFTDTIKRRVEKWEIRGGGILG